jgi:uncharacterized iron-regulated membrane protein
LITSVGALGLIFPMFGATLIAILAAERIAFRRIPAVSAWLGLRA